MACKALNWSWVDTALYQQTFTGRARRIQRCTHCFSEYHHFNDCPDNTAPPTLMFLAQELPTQTTQPPPQPRRQEPPHRDVPTWEQRQDICQNFNQVCCRSQRCRYLHICNNCQLTHPEVVCLTPNGLPFGSRPRQAPLLSSQSQ